MLKNSLIPFITKEEIHELCVSLAKQIEADYEGRDLVVISPLRGSIFFAADLCRQIDLPLRLDFVHVISGPRIMKDISFEIKGTDVLIVEEIIDVGKSLNFLRSRLLASEPRSLKIATLIDKPARRELSIKADYIGRTIDDRHVVGYGMDSDELGRNYKDIYLPKN